MYQASTIVLEYTSSVSGASGLRVEVREYRDAWPGGAGLTVVRSTRRTSACAMSPDYLNSLSFSRKANLVSAHTSPLASEREPSPKGLAGKLIKDYI